MENFTALFLFTLIMTITPGPNNMLLTLSGSQFGYKKTLPFIGGIVLGILSQLFLSALGLGLIFERFPYFQKILKVVGTAYILYLAYKIAFTKKRKSTHKVAEKPLGYFQGAAFQYMNPKAYIMTVTAISVYSTPGEKYIYSVGVIIMTFTLVTPFSISLWAGFGSLLGRVSGGDQSIKINLFLGLITAGSALLMLV